MIIVTLPGASSLSKKATAPTDIKSKTIQAPKADFYDILFFDTGGIYACIIGTGCWMLFSVFELDSISWCLLGFLMVFMVYSELDLRLQANEDFKEAVAYHAVHSSLVGGAVLCLCFSYAKCKEQKNRANAIEFVGELVKQERESEGKGRVSTKKQRAPAPARQRKERSSTKLGAEEPTAPRL